MTGPYPPQYGAGPAGPQMYPEPYPPQYPPVAQPYPNAGVGGAYPGALPPPVQYPSPKRRRWIIAAVAALVVALVVGVIAAIALRGGDEPATSGALTEASAQTAIQNYLDALTDGDAETVARHTLCGLFDSVKERRSDMALALSLIHI